MAVALRLQRHGQKGRPFYRMVATDIENRRDGKFLEIVGTFNPMVEPPALELKADAIKAWIDKGAKPTQTARVLINKTIPGYIDEKEKAQREKIQARRKARNERSPQKPKEKKSNKKKGKKASK